MTDELTVDTDSAVAVSNLVPKNAPALVTAWLESHAPSTRRAYARDIAAFATFMKAATAGGAVAQLFEAGRGGANAIVLRYRTALRDERALGNGEKRCLSAATINRRLAALRSCVALGRLLGLVDFEIDIQGLEVVPYRDTRGPGVDGVRKLLGALEGTRDRAIVHLLYDVALRRFEVCSLDLGDYDRQGKRLQILGKGRHAKEWISLPEPTIAALDAWIDDRGTHRGPMFIALDRAHHGMRLSSTSVYRIVTGANDRVKPHGLRHSAITNALHLMKGDVRAVAKFSRHRDIRVVERYDDNLQDLGGDVASKVAGAL